MRNINESSGKSGGGKPILSFRGGGFRFPFTTSRQQKPQVPTSPGSSQYNTTQSRLRKLLGYKIGFLGSHPTRKTVNFPLPSSGMDWKKKMTSDHTEMAYTQAVNKLRSILSPKSTPPILTSPIRSQKVGDLSRVTPSFVSYNPTTYSSYLGSSSPQDDLMKFIDKQGEYIAQLEKETKYSREELSSMLNNVRDVISENEALHMRKKDDLLSSMMNQIDEKTGGSYYNNLNTSGGSKLSGKSLGGSGDKIIIDSKIAELEAQLSQTKRNLRLAQEEVLEMRNKDSVHDMGSSLPLDKPYANCDIHRAEIDRLFKEKNDLLDTLSKFKSMMSELKNRESEAAKKVKHSLEIVEALQVEKSEKDMETSRLKDELGRHQQRIRDLIQDHSKRIQEEKLNVENKYRVEIDHLNNEMNNEMDSLTKARLELDRQKRIESDVRRELYQKTSVIEDLRQEMQIKLNHLQNELGIALSGKSSAEQELINAKLQIEKIERDSKQEVAKYQAEINGLRRRFDHSDMELGRNDEVIGRLNDTIQGLQRELSLAKLRAEDMSNNKDGADLVNVLTGMEQKHARDMCEMEKLIGAQNHLLDKLRDECKTLTDKLEETSAQYKREKRKLLGEKERLKTMHKGSESKCAEMEKRIDFYTNNHEALTSRLHKLEAEDKSRSERIFGLLSKQQSLLKENQNLHNEVSRLKNRINDASSFTL